MKAMWLAIVTTSLIAAAIGCGLDLGGKASLEPDKAVPQAVDEGGSDPPATARDGGHGGLLVDGDPAPDATVHDAAPDGTVALADATSDAHDASEPALLADAGPSHGTMICGSDAAVCDLTSNVCCTCPNCFAPYPTGCFPTLTGCVGVVFSGVYARLTCGDSTNCVPGSICCAAFDSNSALTGSACVASCPSSEASQLCTSTAQCAAGTSCQPLASAPGFSACQ